MINDFIAKEDLSLFTSGSRFSVGSVFFKEGLKDAWATFDLFVRELPPSRNYLVFAGLEHIISYLENLKFNSEQLDWLTKEFKFTDEEREYYKNFKFHGDVWAMPEGTIFFQNEPIVRISGPIMEVQLIEMFLINTVYLQTIIASKFARFVIAANGKKTTVGFNRSYGLDAAMKSARLNKIFNSNSSIAGYNFKHGFDAFSTGTFHYLIMAFEQEIDAFKAYIKYSNGQGYILIDTYDSINGIKNFIIAAKDSEKEGIKMTGIQLDSGDLYELSIKARKMLDEAGLEYIKIMGMSNLDEFKVAELEKRGAPIDYYAGTTGLLTPIDAPTIELVFKLSEITIDNKNLLKMKLASGKTSFPGKKQIVRQIKDGKYISDIIATDQEEIPGKKLLLPIIKDGVTVYSLPTLEEIGQYFTTEKEKFDRALFDVNEKINYPVNISSGLQEITDITSAEIRRKHYLDVA